MSAMEWTVIAGAAAAIGWVGWYFFLAGRTHVVAAAADQGGAGTDVVITVDGGYSPNTVHVPANRPVRLVFDRKDDSGCTEEVVFPDLGIRRYLPTGRRTVIELPPAAAGRYGFTCGMGMLRGALLAEEVAR